MPTRYACWILSTTLKLKQPSVYAVVNLYHKVFSTKILLSFQKYRAFRTPQDGCWWTTNCYTLLTSMVALYAHTSRYYSIFNCANKNPLLQFFWYFPTSELNTEIHRVDIRIQYECGERNLRMRTVFSVFIIIKALRC